MRAVAVRSGRQLQQRLTVRAEHPRHVVVDTERQHA
jgi:hypothetical protein